MRGKPSQNLWNLGRNLVIGHNDPVSILRIEAPLAHLLLDLPIGLQSPDAETGHLAHLLHLRLYILNERREIHLPDLLGRLQAAG